MSNSQLLPVLPNPVDSTTCPPTYLSDIKIRYEKTLIPLPDPVIDTEGAAQLLYNSWNHDIIEYKEELRIMLIGQGNYPIGVCLMGIGIGDAVLYCPREIFTIALLTKAVAIIVAHNHPSGNLKMSQADYRMKKTLEEGGKILNIKVLDFLIMAPDGRYYTPDNDRTSKVERITEQITS